MILILTIYSKHKKSFLAYLFAFCIVINKLSIIKKLINKSTRVITFALLKSPHINKSAQQHFGFNTFRRTIMILSVDLIRFVLLTKLYTSNLSNPIYICIKYCFVKKFIIVKKCFLNSNSKLIKYISLAVKKTQYLINLLNITCFKVLIKKLITQWKSIRLINEKLIVRFYFS